MTAPVLDRAKAERLARIAGLFGSVHHGERATAALKFHQTLGADGLTISDLFDGYLYLQAAPRPTVVDARPSQWDIRTDPLCPWRNTARAVAEQVDLNHREREFVRDMMATRERPSGPQLDWLNRLAARVDGGMRRAA